MWMRPTSAIQSTFVFSIDNHRMKVIAEEVAREFGTIAVTTW